ncbi:hypothetical protein [Rhizobium sp. IMFF44]|uniref:hypothetical protein n=1 Tax=Rhizobium sp. IMFF44 TaxID=3342350 RepID=UPI0035B9CF91
MSRLVKMVKYSDLDERPHARDHVDIANLTLDVYPESRVFFAGDLRKQRTFIGVLEGSVRPLAGSVVATSLLISSGSVVSYLRRKRNKTVLSAAVSFLDNIGAYRFGSRRDIQDILATGGLLEYSYVRVASLTEVEERALAIVLMMYSRASCVVFSERDFNILPDQGVNLGEEICVNFSDRTIILTGATRSPSWFKPSQTVLII